MLLPLLLRLLLLPLPLPQALAVLELNKPRIRDQLGMQQMQAAIYLKLGRLQEAQKAYRALVAILPDDYNMHAGLHRAMGLPAAEEGEGPANGGSAAATAAPLPLDAARRAQLDATYAELQAAHPRSAACRRIPLDFASGEEFRSLADTYVRRYLTSGIPSLFADLKPLYRDAAKAATLQQLFHGYLDALTSTGALPPLAAPPGGGAAAAASGGKERAEAGEKKEPQTLSWVLLYLAQHYDLMGDSEAALRYVDGAARHTPTIIECYSIKARLLKHMGCPEGAALMADRARMMDLSDRYLNSMAAKALLTADSIELAERTAALFTKDSDTLSALADMQHMWLEVARGWAYQRRGQLGPALKNFLAVDKSFADIQEDQFDFHSYCIRKMTLRSYMVRTPACCRMLPRAVCMCAPICARALAFARMRSFASLLLVPCLVRITQL